MNVWHSYLFICSLEWPWAQHIHMFAKIRVRIHHHQNSNWNTKTIERFEFKCNPIKSRPGKLRYLSMEAVMFLKDLKFLIPILVWREIPINLDLYKSIGSNSSAPSLYKSLIISLFVGKSFPIIACLSRVGQHNMLLTRNICYIQSSSY